MLSIFFMISYVMNLYVFQMQACGGLIVSDPLCKHVHLKQTAGDEVLKDADDGKVWEGC